MPVSDEVGEDVEKGLLAEVLAEEEEFDEERVLVDHLVRDAEVEHQRGSSEHDGEAQHQTDHCSCLQTGLY